MGTSLRGKLNMECKCSKKCINPGIEVKYGRHTLSQITQFKYPRLSITQNNKAIFIFISG